MNICIDIDDYHSFPRWDCSDILLKLISDFPGIKITLFVTPYMNRYSIMDYPRAIDRVKNMVLNKNIEIFLHGYTHIRFIKGEFGALPKFIIKKKILNAMSILEKVYIPFKKGFKFPWQIYNKAGLRVLEELGFILFSKKYENGFEGRQVIWSNYKDVKKRYIQTKEYVYGKPQDISPNDIIYYHGHAQDFGNNGIRESYKTFVQELSVLCKNTDYEFIFCSQIADLIPHR